MFDKTVQVAGIASLQEARMLLDCGVDYLGFPLHLDVHEQDVSEHDAREIIRRTGADRAVVITYLSSARDVYDLLEALGAMTVQLHGFIEPAELATLRRARPEVTVIKSIVIRPGAALDLRELLRRFEPYVDAFITDTFDPISGASGATGNTHDWALSRRVARASTRPVILGGGLRPDNVTAAIRKVLPAAVDVHTGVEDRDGRKSKRRTEQFVRATRAAFASA